jgi:chemotaxis protein CheZ
MSEINKENGNENSNAVRELMNVTRDMASGNFTRKVESEIYGELGELARYINLTQKRLHDLEPNIRITSEKIPMASSSLSDITKETEEATHRIMGLTEGVLDNHELIASGLKKLKENKIDPKEIGEIERLVSKNKEDLIEIITCLSFQDLTGQKINKIMEMMRDVESRILGMIMTFGLKMTNKEESVNNLDRLMSELNGTASDDLKQNLVDDMLKTFGF